MDVIFCSARRFCTRWIRRKVMWAAFTCASVIPFRTISLSHKRP
jgi:hypothetical protein